MALNVLSAGAVKAALQALAPRFTQATGVDVALAFGTAGNIRQRLQAGVDAGGVDVALATLQVVEELARGGLVAAETVVELGRTSTGICVPTGRALPPIDTVEQVRRLLLDVETFAYTDPAAGGTSGTFFAALLERLGVAEAVAAKAVLCRNGEHVAETVAAGRAAAGSTFVSEMMAVSGVAVVGALPAEIGSETIYGGAVVAGTGEADAARALLDYVTASKQRDVWVRAGLA